MDIFRIRSTSSSHRTCCATNDLPRLPTSDAARRSGDAPSCEVTARLPIRRCSVDRRMVRFEDADLRASYLLLSEDRWTQLLSEEVSPRATAVRGPAAFEADAASGAWASRLCGWGQRGYIVSFLSRPTWLVFGTRTARDRLIGSYERGTRLSAGHAGRALPAAGQRDFHVDPPSSDFQERFDRRWVPRRFICGAHRHRRAAISRVAGSCARPVRRRRCLVQALASG
jgi:hypothetical protein